MKWAWSFAHEIEIRETWRFEWGMREQRDRSLKARARRSCKQSPDKKFVYDFDGWESIFDREINVVKIWRREIMPVRSLKNSIHAAAAWKEDTRCRLDRFSMAAAVVHHYERGDVSLRHYVCPKKANKNSSLPVNN